MPLEDFRHQRIHRAATSGQGEKYLAAVAFFIEGSFDAVDLSPDSAGRLAATMIGRGLEGRDPSQTRRAEINTISRRRRSGRPPAPGNRLGCLTAAAAAKQIERGTQFKQRIS
jgi:hypothetical protein